MVALLTERALALVLIAHVEVAPVARHLDVGVGEVHIAVVEIGIISPNRRLGSSRVLACSSSHLCFLFPII